MAIDPEQIERVYSNYAGVYDRVFGRVFQGSREAVVRNLKVEPGERVLEVGVGTGLCLPLYPPNCDITAIDLAEPMLEKAAARVKEHGLTNVKLIRMDAGAMDFPDSTFVTVIASYGVTAVPAYRKIMKEMIYPGQIKITVIREKRAVNYAK